jgi:hypothetical protein
VFEIEERSFVAALLWMTANCGWAASIDLRRRFALERLGGGVFLVKSGGRATALPKFSADRLRRTYLARSQVRQELAAAKSSTGVSARRLPVNL